MVVVWCAWTKVVGTFYCFQPDKRDVSLSSVRSSDVPDSTTKNCRGIIIIVVVIRDGVTSVLPLVSRFDRTPTCDGQTDRQTHTGPSLVPALAWRRAGNEYLYFALHGSTIKHTVLQ